MKINYELKKQDLIHFYNFFVSKKGKKRDRIIKKTLTFLYFGSILTYIIYEFSGLNIILSIVIGIAAGCLLIFVLEKYQKEAMLKTSKSVGELQTLEINSSGLNKHNNKEDNFVNWNGIVAIAQDDNEVYFFTNPKCALIIPIRSFDSLGHKTQFVLLAEEYKKAYISPNS